jgi:hypothetical protein
MLIGIDAFLVVGGSVQAEGTSTRPSRGVVKDRSDILILVSQ